MATDHSVIIPSLNNVPNPSGTLQYSDQPGPSPDNMLQCSYACTDEDCAEIIELLWDGQYFSLPSHKANEPDFGEVSFVYSPPLSSGQ